ncbi:hypothetical protein CN683_24680 [Bacillus toyonensis]|nr:hypothetical protein COO15_08735 [Bacillus toyonensis]PEK11568.1 hypothetical protein CN683_24680 [Bacillus toyonensis]PEN63101.1 hypothetical protein CN545_28135 [Bacillus toyonensis]PGC87679.1 hypothetical protein COM29_13245 [Bacillus toyonensis]PHA05814.1 hypothetical protein COE66_29180 [Bacillus toyonensis]
MEEKKYGITLVYFCSFVIFCLLNYLLSIIIFMLFKSGGAIYGSFVTAGSILIVGILGSVILNRIFRPLICEKNTLLTWLIFVAHLILIPYGSICMVNLIPLFWLS